MCSCSREETGRFDLVSNEEVRLVDEPQSKSMFVSLNRVRTCYEELPDVSWKGSSPQKYAPTQQPVQPKNTVQGRAVPYTGPVTRSRSHATSLC